MIATYPPNLRWYLYLRVSSEDQLNGHSLDSQREIGERFITQCGGQLVQTYIDEAQSAYKGHRPQFTRMVADALNGGCNAIAVYKIDRYARNTIVSLQTMQQLEANGIRIASISEQIDFSTPYGKKFFTELSADAQFYSERLSEVTKLGKAQRAKKGLWNGDAPFGYDKAPTGETRHNRPLYQLTINQHEAAAVKLIYQKTIEGETALTISQQLNDLGYRTRNKHKQRSNLFKKDSVRDILSREFYTGVIIFKGERYPAQHPAIIDRQTYQRAAAKRRQNQTKTANHQTRPYPLANLLYCHECKNKLWGQTLNNQQRYYRDHAHDNCEPCTQYHYHRAETLETQLAQLIAQIQLPQSWQQQILQHLQQPAPTDTAQRARALTEKLKRLNDLYIDGHIDKPTYTARKNEYQSELNALQPAPQPHAANLSAAADLLKNFGDLYARATPTEQKRLFGHIIQKAFTLQPTKGTTRIIAIQPTYIFYPLMVVACGPDGITTANALPNSVSIYTPLYQTI